MEIDRGKYGMRAGMREGGVGAFARAKDKKVIHRAVTAALSEAIESAKKWYPPGQVPELPKGVVARIIQDTLNALALEGKITRLLCGKRYAVNPDTMETAIVSDPEFEKNDRYRDHRWKTKASSGDPNEPTEMVSYCADCGAEYYEETER